MLHPREVPLGGPRAIRVRRTLPQRERSLIGAWCFADHYGPHDVRGGAGMDVPPHPHTGLQTVSWLFSGEVEHRDSAGRARDGAARRAEPDDRGRGHLPLRGVHGGDDRPARRAAVGGAARCPTATPAATSPISCPTPRSIGGAVAAGVPRRARRRAAHPCTPSRRCSARSSISIRAREVTLDVDPSFEHGVLLDQGSVEVAGTTLDVADLAFQAAGRDRLDAASTAATARRASLLLGGPPFPEQLVMWWNFVGRSHDDIAPTARCGRTTTPASARSRDTSGSASRLPAPPLPNATLRPRPNPGV